MLARFKENIDRKGLFGPDDRILLGYSGGSDSACLLHLLATLGFDVVAGHLNHRQRPEADFEEKSCRAFAESLNCGFVAGSADVPKIASERKLSMEAAGRAARYEFFEQAARAMECRWIATAHTRTDAVETILLNLVRGTGMQGLTGISERRGILVRPLLPFTREETRSYCKQNALWQHDDPANADVRNARSRIRHQVLPALKAINPAYLETVVRAGTILEEESSFLDATAAAALERAEVPINGELSFLTHHLEAMFDRNRLAELPSVLLNRALRLVAGMLEGSLDHRQTVEIAAALPRPHDGSFTVEGGSAVIEWRKSEVHARTLVTPTCDRLPLEVPGSLVDPHGIWSFLSEYSGDRVEPIRAAMQTSFDVSALKLPLHVRSAQSGDSMVPVGFDRKRKVSDLMSESHLTRAARTMLPIVCDMSGPIWIPGVCVSARVAAKATSERVLLLRFARAFDPQSHNLETQHGRKT